MGADRTLMQVKVRCGLGRVGVLGRLYGNSRGMSAPGPKADLTASKSDFRSTPESGLKSDIAPCAKCAISGLMQCTKRECYSINSSARDSSIGGRVRPSAFAVFWLIMSSNLVG